MDWSDAISFSLVDAPRPNHVIQSRPKRILQDHPESGMSPSSQKYINTTSNGVYELIL